jgi:hypothetical protein
MRSLKKLALVATLAIATTAFAASTASAADFQIQNSALNPYTGSISLGLASSTFRLESANPAYYKACNGVSLQGQVTNAGPQPAGTFSSAAITGTCVGQWPAYNPACPVTLPTAPTALRVQQDPNAANGQAELVLENVRVQACALAGSCVYGGTIYGKVTNTNPIRAQFPNPNRPNASVVPLISGSFCQPSATVRVDIQSTSPSGLRLATL